MYIVEIGRTLEKRLSEHKAAVKKQDTKNGIAFHSWAKQHQFDWHAAAVKHEERGYWKRRFLEALQIQQQPQTWTVDDQQPLMAPLAGQASLFSSHSLTASAPPTTPDPRPQFTLNVFLP